MFTIGEFARLGNVSVRMLRHYDATGLLEPTYVDPFTGRRSYAAAQLSRLNRLVALKDLGFSLEQVGQILDDAVGAEELRGMLRLRRAELVEQIATDRSRLDRVERRLRTIEKEHDMIETTVTTLPAVRVAERRATAESLEAVGAVIQPLFGELAGALAATGAPLRDSAIAFYDLHDDGTVGVHAAFPFDGDDPGQGNTVTELPEVPRAITTQHFGPLDDVADVWQALGAAMEQHGLAPSGASAREVYLHMPMDDPGSWVTALQWPVD